MEYHSVYMIFELLYLKYQIEEDSAIKLEDLRNAFFELEYNINDINGTKQELDFDSELERVLEDFSCIFECFNDEISFKDEDIDALYEVIPEFLDEEPTAIDKYMEDFIFNDSIFYALRLNPPLNEMQSIFETNKAILTLYRLIAIQEASGKDTTIARKMIIYHKNNLQEFFKNADNKTRIKIKLCLAYYNNKFLSNEAKPNINASWYIALLSNREKSKNALTYDKIFYFIDREQEDAEESENKDNLNKEFNENSNPEDFLFKAYYVGDELEYFLGNYILYLNHFINQFNKPEVKRLLIQKKYLLLSIGDLNDTEEYYLSEGTLDNLPLPIYIKEWFNQHSFDFLIGNFEEILNNIRISNQDLTAINESNIIINLLLLKCFLELSLNEEIKNKLIAEISNPKYYHNSEFSIMTNYIDDIIFSKKGFKRHRHN